MTKSFRNIPILFVAILAITACSNNGKADATRSGKYTTDSIVRDTTISLTSQKGSPTLQLSLHIQYLTKGNKCQSINDTLLRNGVLRPDYLSLTSQKMTVTQAIDSFIRHYAHDYITDYGDMYRRDTSHPSTYSVKYTVGTTIQFNKDNTITYIARSFYYGGGEYGVNQTLALNFSTATGSRLILGNIFVPGFKKRLTDKIVKEMCHRYDKEDITQLNDMSVFNNIDPYPSENFILNEGEISFIYNESEIANRDMGEIVISLPYSEIEDILRKDFKH